MTSRKKKVLLVLLLVLVSLPPGAYFMLDAWLESSGGRQMLERSLSSRAGMPVRLNGEFQLMLLPDIGVSGTELRVGDAAPGSEFVSSREFEISVALKPLLNKQVIIDWVRLTGGRVFPDRYAPEHVAGDPSGDSVLLIPEIRELTIRDFHVVLAGSDETTLEVSELSVREFAVGRDTPFILRIEDLLGAEGSFRWDAPQSLLRFDGLKLDLSGQAVTGSGCLFVNEPRSLHFDLRAGELDIDALQEKIPDGGGSAEDGELPLDLRIRLGADQLRSSGTVATGVVLNLGEDPACP